jgi:hypothetical protein
MSRIDDFCELVDEVCDIVVNVAFRLVILVGTPFLALLFCIRVFVAFAEVWNV